MGSRDVSIAWRGKLAEAVAQVHQQRPDSGEASGRISCPACNSPLVFTITSDGRSRGSCTAGCGVRWSH